MPRGKQGGNRSKTGRSSGGNKRGKSEQNEGFFHEIGRAGGQEQGRTGGNKY